MIIDIILFVLLAMAIFKGFSRGFIVAVFSFLAFIVGIAAALKLSATVASSLQQKANVSGSWLPAISFFLVFIAVVIVVRLGAKLLKKAVSLVLLGWADTIAGIILYALLYVFIYSVILFYAANLGLISPGTQNDSATFHLIEPFGPKVINGIGKVLPFFSNMFGELSTFFGNVADKP